MRWAAILPFLLAAPTFAADTVDYLRDVKPILKSRCFACHGALKQESSLRLDTAAAMRKGGDSGPAIVQSKPAESLLIERVSEKEESLRMPPEGQPLKPGQIAAIREWIRQGAPAPKEELPETDPRDHWAFQPPVRTQITRQEDQNPIDVLLAAERAKRGLKTVGEVDRRLLLRRVYLDLIGLPPTRAEMQQFLGDESDDAFERVVTQLLGSPQYGERWGRHWMDVWRYTDWYGLGAQLRNSQKHIWHWRDWIIESLNEDKGYDRMVREMLAGDEIAPTDRDTLRATGFLARNYYLFNRTTWLDSTIEHTSKAFLGLTMNCCKCHDHKYDPLSHKDYYRMRAVFEPHQVRLDPLPGQTDLEKNGLPRVFDAHPDAKTYLHIRGNEKEPDESEPLPPAVPAILAWDSFEAANIALPLEAYRPSLQEFVFDDHLNAARAELEKAAKARRDAELKLRKSELASAAVAEKVGGHAPKKNAPFLHDDFATEHPGGMWTTGPGSWKYAEGKLTQSKTGAARAYLRSTKNHPENFVATLVFKTLGGERWKSVGLAFDVTGGKEKLVYLSAVKPGSKLQVSYKTGPSQTYPPDAAKALPVELNRTYEMQIVVNGQVVKASLDGAPVVTYTLPVPRETGKLDLVAFDARVEFDSLKVERLAPGADGVAVASFEQAQAELAIAEAKYQSAKWNVEAMRTAHAADVAKHTGASKPKVDETVRAAAVAARRLDHANARITLTTAERELIVAKDAKSKAAAKKKLAAAQKPVATAFAAIQKPGAKYTSLKTSRKALEGPAESAVSRNAPYPNVSTGRRTALANWITDRRNPLTARVAVNHIWMRHFGQPLVDPVTDFGRRTAAPQQQALLDWLAVDFMEHGWSMKRLHQLIVTSHAYRLKSSTLHADTETKKSDPGNAYYWRRRPLRMESEVIRDSLLHLAGELKLEVGGPTIDPGKSDNVNRRSMYFTRDRDHQSKFLSMFDDPDILACYRRSESIVPQQALTLANSEQALRLARKLAANLQSQHGGSEDEFIRAAYETILCVAPTAAELAACREALAQTKAALTERQHTNPTQRARENLVHALLNHNDFVTIR